MTAKEFLATHRNAPFAKRHLRIEAIEMLLEEYAEKRLRLFGVSGSLDLDLLEKRLNEALSKETPESLNEWLKSKRNDH